MKNRLKPLRAERNWTQADLAGLLDVSRQTVNAIEKGKYDLILTGAQADGGAGQVGGMLAAMLDVPYASLVNKIEVNGDKLKVGREIEGGNQEMNEIELPCVLSIQTGINEPRYVSIRGIRKVADVEIPVKSAADLGLEAAEGAGAHRGATATTGHAARATERPHVVAAHPRAVLAGPAVEVARLGAVTRQPPPTLLVKGAEVIAAVGVAAVAGAAVTAP